jgi:hypothetical protein
VDAVTQVVHGRQVVFPQVVQHAQNDLLLEGAQRFGARLVFFLVVRRHSSCISFSRRVSSYR